MVRGKVDDAPDGSCLLYVGADGGEGGGDVIEGRYERSLCVSDKFTLSWYFLRAAMRGRGYFSGFFSILMSRPKSLEKHISMRMMVACFLLNEIGSREGEFGTPLA